MVLNESKCPAGDKNIRDISRVRTPETGQRAVSGNEK